MNTHDFDVQFNPDGRVEMHFLITKEPWDPIEEGRWDIDGNRLTWITTSPRLNREPRRVVWLITRIGPDCFSIKGEDSSILTLVRQK